MPEPTPLVEQTVIIGADGAARFAATIDRPTPRLEPGDTLGVLAHWWSFPDLTATSELGVDGHPPRHPALPGDELPVRMFAGATLRRTRPLRVGDRATLAEALVGRRDTSAGDGRPLSFATIRWTISVGGEIVLVEDRTVVYTVPGPPPEGRPDAGASAWRRVVVPDERMLFRFSAVSWNAHRIHYDRRFATEVDGHPDLVVHGPLLAALLADLWEHQDPRPIADFDFRARMPLHAHRPVQLVGGPDGDLRALADDGSVAMTARVRAAEGGVPWTSN